MQRWAQRVVPAARAALVFALEPGLAALVAAAVWGERLTLSEGLGGALVVVGVVVARSPAANEQPEPRGD